MGYDTRGLSYVAAADLALEGMIRLADDLDIPQSFTTLPDYTKSRVGTNGFPSVSAEPAERTIAPSPSPADATTVGLKPASASLMLETSASRIFSTV